jgi:hypothetical protein
MAMVANATHLLAGDPAVNTKVISGMCMASIHLPEMTLVFTAASPAHDLNSR